MSNRGNRMQQLPEGEKPPSVTVKLKRGTFEIEITCAPEKVQEMVESVLAGMASKEQVSIEASLGPAVTGEAKRDTCRGLLEKMWKEGWFGSERDLGEVHEELSRRGYHYDRTAVSHALVDLVREGTLFRAGTMRNYRYVQKRPLEPQGAGA